MYTRTKTSAIWVGFNIYLPTYVFKKNIITSILELFGSFYHVLIFL